MSAEKGRRRGQVVQKLGRAGKWLRWDAGGRGVGEVAAGRGRWWRPAAAEVVRNKEIEGLGKGGEARWGWE
jgi:hypothetical protein